jgi:hypothetical protein
MLEDLALIVRVQWSHGGGAIVHTTLFTPVSDALSANDFSAPDGHSLIVAHRGRVINPAFSFHYHGIVNGHRLVCMVAKPRRRIRRFLESSEGVASRFVAMDRLELSVGRERARLRDLVFAHWEPIKEFPLVLSDLLREDEQMTEEDKDTRWPTVVPHAGAMGERPIPAFFKPECCVSPMHPQGLDCPYFSERTNAPGSVENGE